MKSDYRALNHQMRPVCGYQKPLIVSAVVFFVTQLIMCNFNGFATIADKVATDMTPFFVDG